jgi:14-3-3 protein epsilon
MASYCLSPAPYYTPDAAGELALDDLVFMARLAEQCDRFDDMVHYMQRVATGKGSLDVEERNLLSVAYKNVAGTRRAAWRVLSTLIEGREAEWELQELVRYKQDVGKELSILCGDVTTLLNGTLIPSATKPSEKVFYLKMCGDYERYKAEISSAASEEGMRAIAEAKRSYEAAREEAERGRLEPTSPTVLGLALNLSVFHYEILNDPRTACAMAKRYFDEAVEGLDALEEDSYKDATLIMQLLRDNLTLWTEEQQLMRDGA